VYNEPLSGMYSGITHTTHYEQYEQAAGHWSMDDAWLSRPNMPYTHCQGTFEA